jgi:hypothetical protein
LRGRTRRLYFEGGDRLRSGFVLSSSYPKSSPSGGGDGSLARSCFANPFSIVFGVRGNFVRLDERLDYGIVVMCGQNAYGDTSTDFGCPALLLLPSADFWISYVTANGLLDSPAAFSVVINTSGVMYMSDLERQWKNYRVNNASSMVCLLAATTGLRCEEWTWRTMRDGSREQEVGFEFIKASFIVPLRPLVPGKYRHQNALAKGCSRQRQQSRG